MADAQPELRVKAGRFPFYRQFDAMDCGPTCLKMIARYYGRTYSLPLLRDRCYLTREGVSFAGISQGAESIGLRTLAVRLDFAQLSEEVPLPCVAHWQQNHFVVVYKVKRNKVYVADPAHALTSYSRDEFMKQWGAGPEGTGLVLLLEPSATFYSNEETDPYEQQAGLKVLIPYIRPHWRYVVQLMLGMVFGSMLSLVFPFLTQALVDSGITNQDLSFVYTILLAQLMLFLGRTAIEIIRGWLLLHVSSRMNIALISDFLIKLMKLPMSFFNTKMTGDLLQRIDDHRRVESFLTSTTLNVLFASVNLVVFAGVLALYSWKIFAVFLAGSAAAALWILGFMKRRYELDHRSFVQRASNREMLIQLIGGIEEIKINNCERQKRWGWERVQARLFKINERQLAVTQYQQAGSQSINELKNILVTVFAATEVIEGRMTLGMMLAVSYIIGQVNQPIEQLLGFAQTTQDARLSLERLAEIHGKPDEEPQREGILRTLPEDRSINVQNLHFRYEGPNAEPVLSDVSLHIPAGRVTAIVGTSGSGKTTLLKLLLKFYPPTRGEIRLGNMNLANFDAGLWRQRCGVVMQDGYIFSDTIARNVALGEDRADMQRLTHALRAANIHEFVESLPLAYNTRIGESGNSLSQGQRQRILIARAVYKDPEYLFFDEATSSLDANNERTIMENLDEFMRGRTTVVIAHRLSTVKNADQIVVLEKGKIVERGSHEELTRLRGAYFRLVKNQLELGA
ncbi:peptidase domain-containing ABC transporter [Sorangium sp. So ce385]|uniref:peptidase domain-containing ABC transporter n=1 Tax=Sorangium sp. So ce385 TaxID=3133308 RepID=UPI003F5BE3F3